jgi:ribonucleoside-diphosphate reductase alpha chain
MKLSDSALKIVTARYFYDEKEDWQKLSERVGREAGRYDNSDYAKRFGEIIFEGDFLPGGRILRNIGRPRGSLYNCYVLPVGDSREEIGQWLKDSLILWGEGGGVGCNISFLRPKGAPIKGVGGASSGPVSFLEASDSVAKTVESGGSRRAAALATMLVSHPDILDFIDSKLIHGKLSHYNISVAVTEEFLEAVEKNDDWEFKFAQQSYGKIKARVIWNKVMDNMVRCAEPGLLNWDNLRSNNSYFYDPILSTNPCQPSWATVLTPCGISTISDIKIGDMIWSENGWVKVINKVSSGIKDVYRYKTNANVFYGTDNHKIVQNGEKIEVDSAESIDLLNGSSLNIDFNLDKQSIIDGLLIGDGSVHLPAEKHHTIYLCIGKYDQDYFTSEIKDYLITNRKGIKDYAWEVKTDLMPDDIPLTYMRKVPKQYKYGNFNKVLSFLRGLFSANGSVIEGGGGRISLKASSNQLIEDVQIMLSAIGIQSYITTNSESLIEWKNEKTYKSKKSYNLNITKGRFLFEKYIGFIQKYKQEKLQKINRIQLSNKIKKSYKIYNKSYISKEEVFDITVDGEQHTYWSGGCNVSNCGEVPLGANSVCNLGSLVLPNFITGNINTNWKKLEQTIKLAVRFLDNIIDINKYVLQPIEVSARNGRRIGIGVMGLAEYLFYKKLRYGSKKAIDEIEKLMKFIRDAAYEASVELAVEKGAFPKFDPVQYGKAHFIRTLPASLRMMIKDKGIRNVTLMAMAPTGTISLIPEVSSGIEPLFSKAYRRKDRVSERVYIHPLYKQIIESGEETPEWFVDVKDLKPADHFETQSIIQRYTDGAVSKTVNMPKGTTSEDLSRLTLEYIRDLKGVTVYVDESREGQILSHMPDEDVRKHIKNSKETESVASEETVKCVSGVCEL